MFWWIPFHARLHVVYLHWRRYSQISINANWEYFKNKAKEQLSSEIGHQIYGQRKIDVEPIFANLKAHLGFKRFSVRGLSATWNEVGIALMANNLVKLAKVSANLKGMDKNRKEILTNREFPSCFFIESELCPELQLFSAYKVNATIPNIIDFLNFMLVTLVI